MTQRGRPLGDRAPLVPPPDAGHRLARPARLRAPDARLRRPGRGHPRRRRDDDRTGSARSRCPTLVVVGNQDILTPRGDSEELAELIPTAELVVISGAAHGLMIEHASTFNRVLLDFLRARRDRLPGPRRRRGRTAADTRRRHHRLTF